MVYRRTSTLILAMLILAVITVSGCGGGGGAASPVGGPGVTVVTLATQTTGFLSDPHALALSPKDGKLYVADNEPSGFCSPSCIRTVDPVSGVVGTTAVVVGVGIIEGVTFDATGDYLYYTDRQNRLGRLTWGASSYAAAVACNDNTSFKPQDPYRLVSDATLGLLVAEANTGGVMRNASCSVATVPTVFNTVGSITQPRGLAVGPTGNFLVSSFTNTSIYSVDRSTGVVSPYHGTGLNQPLGIIWLAGTSTWANSLLVADYGSSSVVAVNGSSARVITILASPPVDLSLASGSLYVLSAPSGSAPGRIYKITGF